MPPTIDFQKVEEKWQKRWSEAKTFEANPDGRPKYYLTVAYPYPNAPQHIGHARTYTLADVHARYMRMRGYNTLLPMAFHYTGTPILAIAKRIAAGDREVIEIFENLYGVPKESMATFTEPLNIAKYFHSEIKLGMKEMGFSIDWRREFTTIDPSYSRFIEWQFHQLNSRGFITKGVHPIGWCPSCRNPVGQHDTRGDLEPEIGEFTAIKFSLDGKSLLCATLRPETIYGVTNIWLNPEAIYAEVQLGDEVLIVSERAAGKLSSQAYDVQLVRTMKGSSIIGRFATNPINGSRIPILPASFVDPSNATGVVMSVPAHAPYDLLALRDLTKHPEALAKYCVGAPLLIEPVPVIKIEGYSRIPAQDVVDRMGVKDQNDPRAEEATKEVYQKEFHGGVMLPYTGKYAGLPVGRAKESVKKDLIENKLAIPFCEILNGPIYCRCGCEVIVSLLGDQWFINYGDEGWKDAVRAHLREMSLMPEDLRQEFENVVDWLREKACARRSGLGTPLPWDRDWIIESLSDSTIYMAYYAISRLLKEMGLQPSQLDDAFFDYVFLGKGDPSSLAAGREAAEAIRREFLYFYPLDSRHSGRDLVPNHLTFFIFNHVGIFPKELWPRRIVVNGSVLMDGKKMSKSMGNIVPLRRAIRIYGADTLRTSILSASELLQDADFSDSLARSTRSRLEDFYCLAMDYADAPSFGRGGDSDLPPSSPAARWLVSRIQRTIDQVTASMDCLRVREAIHTALFVLQQDVQWYLKRAKPADAETRGIVKYAIEMTVRLMAPFAPHICEEIWERYGHRGFISTSEWPKSDPRLIDERAEISENLLKNLIADTSEIVRVTGIAPGRICYYTAPAWKWSAYLRLLKLLDAGTDPKYLIREAMKDPEVRGRGGEAAKFISSVSQAAVTMQKEERAKLIANPVDEFAALSGSAAFLSAYFGCRVDVFGESPEYDPKGKSRQAIPLRPAIYIEGSA